MPVCSRIHGQRHWKLEECQHDGDIEAFLWHRLPVIASRGRAATTPPVRAVWNDRARIAILDRAAARANPVMAQRLRRE
jgi:hypothetical protein